MYNGLATTAPGLKAARADGEVSLYDWQASNVQRLSNFLGTKDFTTTEGFALCDAPGGGKTLSVLATIVRTIPSVSANKSLVLIFAPNVIVPQWASQITKHFDPDVSGMRIYCDSKQCHIFAPGDHVHDLSTRPCGARGGVYVEPRPTATLPPDSILTSFDVIILSKEVLSLRTDPASYYMDKNDVVVAGLRTYTRLVIVDESHNLANTSAISNQLLNVEEFAGVPKLLVSGTPGMTPRRLYDMLKILRSVSWRRGGGYAQWRKARFARGSDAVLPEAQARLTEELRSCFLHTPAEVIFAHQTPERTEHRITPSDLEVDSYNYVLSIHKRDVVRAGPGKEHPPEWAPRVKKAGLDWQHSVKVDDDQPSADKTLAHLQISANGGELWSVQLDKPVSDHDALNTALKNIVTQNVPMCDMCGIEVAGLLTLPCACPEVVCAECFVNKVKTFGTCCNECNVPRKCYDIWYKEQPVFNIMAARDREFKEEQKVSTAFQMHNQDHNILLQQPTNRPFQVMTEVGDACSFFSFTDGEIADCSNGYTKVASLAVLLRNLRYPRGGAATDAKVIIVPPTNNEVRSNFIATLCSIVGRDAVADLNHAHGKKVETAKVIAKFRSGRGLSWQCKHCGECYEDSVAKCITATYRVKMEAPAMPVLRFCHDITKVTNATSETLFLGDMVRVHVPGQAMSLRDPIGRLVAKGSCRSKRPINPAALTPAPRNSCFVLILNASGVEGLDMGFATHLVKTEPMARADKECQAEARGRRLGASGRLQIVQMFMTRTVEEAQYERKRKRETNDDDSQLAILNSLRLLRHDE